MLKGPCREEKEIEIWKVCKLCPKGDFSMSTLNRKLNWPVQEECTAQKRSSEAEAEMDIRNWEQRDADLALCETENLSLRGLQLHQANQCADQAQREKLNLCGDLEIRNRLLNKSRA